MLTYNYIYFITVYYIFLYILIFLYTLIGVPGHRVGFMPQELAIYSEFTIAETLSYFGRIFNMSSDKIRARTDFLIEFLDLPKENRLVGKLSGGQQRRASLAAALLHEPGDQDSMLALRYAKRVL